MASGIGTWDVEQHKACPDYELIFLDLIPILFSMQISDKLYISTAYSG
jgi:hypothetical protein